MKEFMLKNLEYFRKEKHLTQLQLAEKMNVKRYNIADWEQGRTEPSLFNLVALGKALGVSVETLLGIENFKEKEVEEYYKKILVCFSKPYKSKDDIKKGDLVKMKFDKYHYRPEIVAFKKGETYEVVEVLNVRGGIIYLIKNGNYFYKFNKKEIEIYKSNKTKNR